jgi:fructose-1,6-bisphosphatase/inositol monophosphatase family enzyme
MQMIDALSAIAREAGQVIRRVRAEGLALGTKSGGEIVTSADLASHELLRRRLFQDFPGVALVAEECEDHDVPAAPFLLVDELDGTAPFAAGSAHWGVMIALVDRIPRCGVIHLPDLAVTVTSELRRGTRLNGERVRLRPDVRLQDALLGTEINRHLTMLDWQRLQHASRAVRAVRCTASAAASAFELLNGVTHVYLNLRGGKLWDFAAPALAIAEGGGIIATATGDALRWNALQTSFFAAAGANLMLEWRALLGRRGAR